MADLQPIYSELHLRDNADTDVDVRWTDDDGTPYEIASGAAQVRVTPDAATPLLTGTVTLLGPPDYWVRITFTAADVLAADFESLDPDEPPYWDVVLVRADDSRAMVPVAGRVSWAQGVTR